MKKQAFGKTADGEAVDLYTLTNSKGMEVQITNYGGIIVSLKTPDRAGKAGDVVLGFESLDGYLKPHPFFGALVGRYANRIAKGVFKLNNTEYKLAQNNNGNHIHGGPRGFDKRVWKAREVAEMLELVYASKDGEEGYPGNLTTTVTYQLTDANELKISYSASTDKDTIINLTNHSYFNLAGTGDVLGHEVMINAEQFTPVDETSIPTGEVAAVKGTPFDFTQRTPIGARIEDQHQQINFGKGYDHNWVIKKAQGDALALAASVYEPTSGRVLEVYTTQPGVQFYTGNFLNGSVIGKKNTAYARRSGFCLETQHYPDSPNKPQFPTVVLKPGQKYQETTVFKFSVK
ncbi:MAG: aldose epimerase family protein [Pyrinomonadaceae bacterium]